LTATFNPNEIYPRVLNARESRVVEVAIGAANGAQKVANATARLALHPTDGDLVVQLDNHILYIWDAFGPAWIAVVGGGGGGIPGGLNGQVQFNNSGAFGGDTKFVWDNVNKVVNLNGYQISPLEVDTLNDNQPSTVWITVPAKFVVLEYSLERGPDVRNGHIKVASNGTVASLDDIFINTGDVGVTFSAVPSGSGIQIKYATTSLGTSTIIKYSIRMWS
jgi:hypothetical protein